MNRRLVSPLLALLVVLLAPSLQAQNQRSGAVGGTVHSTDAAPVRGASLTLQGVSAGLAYTTTADFDGRFRFNLVEPGEYTLQVEHFGYQPQFIRGIMVRPAQRLSLSLQITATGTAAERVDTVDYRAGPFAGSGPGTRSELIRPGMPAYPVRTRDLAGLVRRSSVIDPTFQSQGLPGSFTRIRVDGAPITTLQEGAPELGGPRAAAFPLSAIGWGSAVLSNPDVEWTGAGTVLDLRTAGPARGREISVFGSLAPDALRTGGAGAGSRDAFQAGARVSAAVVPDSALVYAGFEALRRSAPVPGHNLPGDEGGELARILGERYGIEPPGTAPRLETEVVSLFGGLAWQLSGTTRLDARGNFASLPSIGATQELPPFSALRSGEGTEFSVGFGLSSRFSDRVAQSFQLGYDGGTRRTAAEDALGVRNSVRLAGWPLGPGSGQLDPLSDVDQSTIRGSQTLYFEPGAHRMKFGIEAEHQSFEFLSRPTALLYFTDLAGLEARTGYGIQSTARASNDFSVLRGALYGQDTWALGSGLEVLLGLRLDLERLPKSEVPLATEWLEVSGLDNTDVRTTWMRLNPRLGFIWNLEDRSGWLITGSAGSYSGTAEARLLDQWTAGGSAVHRGHASFGADALSGGPGQLPASGTRLTMLGRNFAGPRTLRADLAVQRAFGRATALSLSGLVRHTDALPRLTDLNLNVDPVAQDQFGRPLYGDLEMHGGVLAAAAGSNRRFEGFDQVVIADTDGWSTHTAVTLELEHAPAEPWGLVGSYTWSRTRDNTVGGALTSTGGALLPPASAASDWAEGTSDFDVPHRARLGGHLGVGPVRLTGLYNFRSGYPFTPGFGPGLDANGDGVFGNDPAIVDASIPGMEALLERYDCLRGQAGRVVERNACRTDGIHSLDARVSFGIAHGPRLGAELSIDALDLLASSFVVPDGALLLLDPAGEIEGAGTGAITLPLIANDHFGERLRTVQPGRILRLSLRLIF